MKRDFVFVWSPEVQPAIAALSAPKIAQLRASCEQLIARAEYYRRNPDLTVRIAEVQQLRDDDLPWAPFEMFGLWFKLDYQEDQRAYVLHLANPPRSAVRSKPKAARPSRMRKQAKIADERAMLVRLSDAPMSRVRRLRRNLREPLARSVRHFFHYGAVAAAFARNSVGVLCDMQLRWASATRRVLVSSSSTPASGPRGREAFLEPRLLGQNTGITMLVYTLVWNDEPIDWSADLFGAPESEWSQR
jgi:hypothetical protein